MPKATKSQAARILEFFQQEPLSVAEMVLGLAKEVVKQRQGEIGRVAPKKTPTRKSKPPLPPKPRSPQTPATNEAVVA